MENRKAGWEKSLTQVRSFPQPAIKSSWSRYLAVDFGEPYFSLTLTIIGSVALASGR